MQTVKDKATTHKAAQASVDVALQRHDVATLTGIGTEAQQQHLFEEGYKLAHHFLKSEASRSAVTGSKAYWNWWAIQWAKADAVFVHRVQYNEHFEGHTQETLAAIWRSNHSIVVLLEPDTPNRVFLTNGFYSIIESLPLPLQKRGDVK